MLLNYAVKAVNWSNKGVYFQVKNKLHITTITLHYKGNSFSVDRKVIRDESIEYMAQCEYVYKKCLIETAIIFDKEAFVKQLIKIINKYFSKNVEGQGNRLAISK